jgi:2-polyprenyl-3-methyl-5-hydroxy-6-metoxy-1,4-benzoquinol methylase
VDRVLQFVPKTGVRALEIACFPGVLMKKLLELGYADVVGIEPAEKYNDFIGSQAAGATIINGYFPEVLKYADSNLFHCIIGMDVMEHVEYYDDFFRAVRKLLVPHGTAIFMSPIILSDGLFRYRDFHHPDEHAWIHTQKFLEPYLKEMFSEVEFKRWIVGHELIIVKK